MTREPWEIVWHIRLQMAAGYLRKGEKTCQAIGIEKVEATNQAIAQANALVKEHGPLGTDALSAASVSIEALTGTELSGLVELVSITRTKDGHTKTRTTTGNHNVEAKSEQPTPSNGCTDSTRECGQAT